MNTHIFCTSITVCLVWLFSSVVADSGTNRPVVGILALPLDEDLRPHFPNKQYYVPASYVKWLESAGMRVAYFLPSWPADLVQRIHSQVNGVLFTGGAADIHRGQFAAAQQLLISLTISANKALPGSSAHWGTCLGFEATLLDTATPGNDIISRVIGGDNVSLSLDFTPSDCLAPISNCSLLNAATPSAVLAALMGRGMAPVAFNHHLYGVTPAAFASDSALTRFWRIVSTSAGVSSEDELAAPFVSTVEAVDTNSFPMFATQWHPEKPSFEWNTAEDIDHSYASVVANNYMVSRFSTFVRKSSRRFASPSAFYNVSFYREMPAYTGNISHFEQIYVF